MFECYNWYFFSNVPMYLCTQSQCIIPRHDLLIFSYITASHYKVSAFCIFNNTSYRVTSLFEPIINYILKVWITLWKCIWSLELWAMCHIICIDLKYWNTYRHIVVTMETATTEILLFPFKWNGIGRIYVVYRVGKNRVNWFHINH